MTGCNQGESAAIQLVCEVEKCKRDGFLNRTETGHLKRRKDSEMQVDVGGKLVMSLEIVCTRPDIV